MKNMNIGEYLQTHNESGFKENLFDNMLNELQMIHSQKYVINDFSLKNITIDENQKIAFKKITTVEQKDLADGIKKDNLKYLTLMLSSFLNITENEDIKNKLKANSMITTNDVAELYFRNRTILPEFVHEKFGQTKTNSQNAISKGGKQYVKSSGKSILSDDRQPNGFISLVIFPALIIYFFLMVALVYWILALK